MSGFQNNPKHVYVNLAASANSASSFLSIDPEASFFTTRNVPIVDNLALYQLCIVRANLLGCRNLPLLRASIQAGQDDPFRTNWQMTLSVTFGAGTIAVPPVAPPAQKLLLSVYNADGSTFKEVALGVGTSTSIHDVVVALNVGLAAAEAYFSTFSVTQVNTNYLQITQGSPDGRYFELTHEDSTGVDGAAFFGFYRGSPIVSSKSSPSSAQITMPLPCANSGGSTFTASNTQNIQWIPQTAGLPIPPSPLTVPPDYLNEAYFLYDYSYFARLFNNTMKNAFSSVVAAAQAAGYTMPADISFAPSIQYDPARRSFPLTAPLHMWDGGSGPTFSLTLNEELANLMNFPGGSYDQAGNQSVMFDSSVPVYAPNPAQVDKTVLTPDYPATGNGWSPVGSIVFAYSQWNVRAEIVSPVTVYGPGAPSGSSSSDATSNTLTDIVPAIVDASDLVSQPTEYSPQVLRWIDLPNQSGPLRTLDFHVFWQDAQSGKRVPLTLNPTASIYIKLLLQLKNTTDPAN